MMLFQVPGMQMWSGWWPGHPRHPEAGPAHQEGASGGKEVVKRLARDTVKLLSLQVESVLIKHCPSLQLDLDLININASTVTIIFRKCSEITINSMAFETDFSRSQKLKMLFQNIRSAKFQNLYVDEDISFIFENVRTINFADSTFGDLSQNDFTMLQSGRVCVTNSILNLNSQRRPKLITRCPWIHSSMNISSLNLRPVKDTSMSLSSLQQKKLLTKTLSRNQSRKYLSISPAASVITVLIISGVITVIFVIIIISVWEMKKRNRREGVPAAKPARDSEKLRPSNKIMFKSQEEGGESPEIPSPDLKALRRSISAVLLVTHQLKRSNSATLKNVILATEEEFLCWIKRNLICGTYLLIKWELVELSIRKTNWPISIFSICFFIILPLLQQLNQ